MNNNTYTYKPTVQAIQYTGSIDKVIEFIGRENIENFTWRNDYANPEHIEIRIRGKNYYRLFVDYYLVKHTYESGEVRYETMDQLTFDVNFDQAVCDTTESVADTTPCEDKPEQIGRVPEGEWYYYVRSFGRIDCVQDRRLFCDDDRYEMGNYFHTKEEAEQARDEWQLQLKYRQWRKQHDPVVLDWSNGNQQKWFLYYDYGEDDMNYTSNYSCRRIGALCFSACELAERFYTEHKDLIHRVLGVQ